jgi:tRNA A37 methylthiotransferase MiaB
MNRQYTRTDFLRMIDQVRAAFDRPALTTDIIVGFPGESDAEFLQTLDVVDHAGFIHVHAFPYSPRPDTAAARWTKLFVPGAVANERLNLLRSRADDFSLRFRKQFVGQAVEVLVEREGPGTVTAVTPPHGRSERYFDVHFDHAGVRPGDFARVRVDEVTPRRTHGTCLSVDRPTRRAAGGVA